MPKTDTVKAILRSHGSNKYAVWTNPARIRRTRDEGQHYRGVLRDIDKYYARYLRVPDTEYANHNPIIPNGIKAYNWSKFKPGLRYSR